jgi:UrcA family protein
MMSKHTITGALALAVAMAFAPHAVAQTQAKAQARAAKPPMIEGIIVLAPRITYETDRRVNDRTDRSILPYQITEATETVPVAGLDLSRSRDVFLLEERIEAAAKRVCAKLEQKYPRGEPRMDVCVERAVDDAWERVRNMAREG